MDHKILLKHFNFYGVHRVGNDCTKSYLTNRKQFVEINGCASELLNVTRGVPQGSILGPKLFVLYINDICNVSKLAKLILFADDTNIFCAGNNLKQIQGMINGVLTKLAKWFAVNKLSLNLKPNTNYMLFRNRPPDIEINLLINNQQITRVHVTKLLGVYIDEYRKRKSNKYGQI